MTEIAQEKETPFSLAAEAGVLGSILIEPKLIEELLEIIKEPETFYIPANREIYKAIITLYEENKKGGDRGIDAILLRDELEKRNQLDQIGGVEYIKRILDSVPSTANLVYYAEILKSKKILRDIIIAATGILDNAYDKTGDPKETLDKAEKEIFEITNKITGGSFSKIGNLIEQSYAVISSRKGQYITGIETGYYELDGMTCGLHKGEMTILAGRPSMGKTTLAMNMAEHIGSDCKVPIGIISLEMTKENLAEKFLCSTSEIDLQNARKGTLGIKDFERMVEVAVEYQKAEIYIDDTSSLTPLEFRAKARNLKRKYDVQCIIVDYLQLISTGRRTESRQQEITEISRYIKSLAKELDISVIVISQLNRAPEARTGHRPRMSDLRESGSIEQDADVVILMHREDYYRKGERDYEETNQAELIIAKQRNGPTGSVNLIFRQKITRFENMSQAVRGDNE